MTLLSFQNNVSKLSLIQYEEGFCDKKIKDVSELITIAKNYFTIEIRKRSNENSPIDKFYRFTTVNETNTHGMEDEGKTCS